LISRCFQGASPESPYFVVLLIIDQRGADLLYQVISHRYERGSIVLTTNKPLRQWPSIFNNDSTITSAVLDRLLHHAEVVVIEASSYRMQDQIQS
jgi:DNA replication protein DnaC